MPYRRRVRVCAMGETGVNSGRSACAHRRQQAQIQALLGGISYPTPTDGRDGW